MIKAVIFDYGGVVRLSHSCWEMIAAAYSISVETLTEKAQPFLTLFSKGLITENQFWKQLSSRLKKPIPENKKDLWRKSYEKNFRLSSEIIHFVKELKRQGIKTAVLSNTIKPHVEIATRHKGYRDFDVVILSCEVNLQKPEKEIYLLTVKQLRVNPKKCIFIDDKKEYLAPAEELGMKTILAKNPKQVIDDISRIVSP